MGRVCGLKDGQLDVHWYTGTITSQWKPLTLPVPGTRGERQPWKEVIQDTAVITTPFRLTRTARLPGEVQLELRELRDRYIL